MKNIWILTNRRKMADKDVKITTKHTYLKLNSIKCSIGLL